MRDKAQMCKELGEAGRKEEYPAFQREVIETIYSTDWMCVWISADYKYYMQTTSGDRMIELTEEEAEKWRI